MRENGSEHVFVDNGTDVMAECDQLALLIRARAVGSETARRLIRELDLAKARHRG